MKKLLSIVLTLVMVLCLVNLNNNRALADGETNDDPAPCTESTAANTTCTISNLTELNAWASNSNNITGKLIDDLIIDNTIESYVNVRNSNKTLDLNEHIIKNSTSSSISIFLVNSISLTVIGSGIIDGGSAVANVDCRAFQVNASGKLTINGGTNGITIRNMKKNNSGGAINNVGGDLSIENVKIINCSATTGGAIANTTSSSGDIILKNTTITECSGSINFSVGAVHVSKNNLKISGDTSVSGTGNQQAVYVANKLIIDDGATFDVTANGDTPTALQAYGGFEYPTTSYEVKGSTTIPATSLQDATRDASTIGSGVFKVNGENAKYIIIKPIEAEPAPQESGDMTYVATKKAFVSSVQKGNDSLAVHVTGINANESTTTVSKKDDQSWTDLSKTDDLYKLAVGTSGSPFTKLTFNKGYISGLDVGTHLFRIVFTDEQSNNVGTSYVELTITDAPTPKPSPSPSQPVVKDESCEKVIGPTWHWNNTKGVCEEYATVGTATR